MNTLSPWELAQTELAGVPVPTLQQWKLDVQTAIHNLSTGQQFYILQYSQGDGSKMVTYQKTDLGALRSYLDSINAQLGIGSGRRFPTARF